VERGAEGGHFDTSWEKIDAGLGGHGSIEKFSAWRTFSKKKQIKNKNRSLQCFFFKKFIYKNPILY
jgi:hypothetical protein